MRRFVLRGVSATALLLLMGSAPPPPPEPKSRKVSKAEWVDSMKQVMPAIFCAPKTFFRECFKVTEQGCKQTALRVTEACLLKHNAQFPAVLDEKSVAHWGGLVGGCAGEGYEKTMAPKRKKDARCDDPQQW